MELINSMKSHSSNYDVLEKLLSTGNKKDSLCKAITLKAEMLLLISLLNDNIYQSLL